MEYPGLLLAIRSAALTQYEVARRAGMRESRLSVIIRRGGATPDEQRMLSRALQVSQRRLFRDCLTFAGHD